LEKDNNIFDDLLKSQLSDLSGDVSFDSWDAIASKLDALEEKKKRVVPMWWIWSTGIVLTALVIGWFAFNKNDQAQENKPVAKQIVQTPVTPENDSEIKNKYIPTEVPTRAEANEPNQPEKLITLNDKTTAQSGNGANTGNNTTSTTSDAGGQVNKADNPTQEKSEGDKSVADAGDNNDTKADKSADNSTTVLNELPQVTEVDKLPTKNKVDNKLGDSTSKGGGIPSFTTSFTHENYSGWELGFSATPNWAGKFIGENAGQAWRINNKYLDIVNNMERAAISYRVDARVNKYFGHNFYVGAGVAYNQIEENVSYDYILDGWYTVREGEKDILYTPYINPAQYEHVNYKGTNKYRFVEIPVRLGYIQPIAQKRLNLRFETGFKYMYLAGMQGMKTDVSVLELVDLSQATTTYNRNNFGLIGRAGLHYYLNENLDLGFIPYFSTSLTSIRANTEGITDKPFNTGLNISLQYKLSRP
jgi:hypothetical protein